MSYSIQQTQAFTRWHSAIRDLRARIARASMVNLGDIKTLGEGISEMRIDVGVGYRVYFTLRSGDKSSQDFDIRRAKKLSKEI